MQKMRFLVAGVVLGIGFVVACAHMSAGSDAHAAPADCATWQVGLVTGTYDGGPPKTWTLPPGWEPTSLYGSGSGSDSYVWARRCAP